MFAIYVKNYRDAGGEVITTENKLLQIPFTEYNKELGQDITVGYDAGIINPTVKTECGSAGSFEFSMESESPYFNSFLIMKTIIRIEYDGETIFRGRVLSLDDQMWGTRSVHCEGDLAFLLDVQYPGTVDSKRTKQSLNSYISNVLSHYNSYVGDPDKKIYAGNIPGSYSSEYNSEQKIGEETKKHGSSSWQSVGDALNSLKSSYGGWFRTRYENGAAYLDWLNWYFNPKINDQVLSITDNMINISSTVELSDIFTVVIPVGQKTTTKSSKDSTDTSLYIEGYMTDVHGSNKYIRVPDLIKLYSKSQLDSGYHTYEDYANAIDDYGWIYKTVSFSNANTQAKLWSYAVDWIKENYIGKNRQFTITAIDLHSMGYSCDKITVGDRVTVRLPYDSDTERRIFTVLSITYDLYNPENNSYTIGVPTDNKSSKEYGTKNTKTTKSSTPVSKDPGKNDNGFEWDWEERQWNIANGLGDFMRHAGLITDEGEAYLLDHLNDADDERSQGFRVIVNGTTGADFVYQSVSHFLINSTTGVVQQMKGYFGFDEPTGDVDPGFDFSLTGDFTNEMTNVQYDAKHSRWHAKETTTLTHADGGERTYNFGVGIDGTTGYIYAKKLVLIDNDEPFEITNKLIVLGGSVDSLDDNLKGLAAYANELDKSITVVASDVFQVGATMSDQYLELNKGLLDLDKTVTNLSSDVTNIGQTMDTSLSDMTLRLAEMGKTVTNITSDVVNIGQQISDVGVQVTQELASMNITVTNLTSDVTQIGSGLTKAQGDIAKQGDSLFAVNKDVAIINATLTVLGGDIPEGKTKKQFIADINADLQSKYSDLKDYFGEDEVIIPELAKVVYVDNLVANNLSVAKAYADSVVANKVTAAEVNSIIGKFKFIEAESIDSQKIVLDKYVRAPDFMLESGNTWYSMSSIFQEYNANQRHAVSSIAIEKVNNEDHLVYYTFTGTQQGGSMGHQRTDLGAFSRGVSVNTLTGNWDAAGIGGKASFTFVAKDQNGNPLKSSSTYVQGAWESGSYKVKQPNGDVVLFTNLTDISSEIKISESEKAMTVKVLWTSPYDTSATVKETGFSKTISVASVYNEGWTAAYKSLKINGGTLSSPTENKANGTVKITIPNATADKTSTLSLVMTLNRSLDNTFTKSSNGTITILKSGASTVLAQSTVKLTASGWITKEGSTSYPKGIYRVYAYNDTSTNKCVSGYYITGDTPYNNGNKAGWADAVGKVTVPTSAATSDSISVQVPDTNVGYYLKRTYKLEPSQSASTSATEYTYGYVNLYYRSYYSSKSGSTDPKSTRVARAAITMGNGTWYYTDEGYEKGRIRVFVNNNGTKCTAVRLISGAEPYNKGYNAGKAEASEVSITEPEAFGLVPSGWSGTSTTTGTTTSKSGASVTQGYSINGDTVRTDVRTYFKLNGNWKSVTAYIQSVPTRIYAAGKSAGGGGSTSHSISYNTAWIKSNPSQVSAAFDNQTLDVNLGTCTSGYYYGIRVKCGSTSKRFYWKC